MSDEKLAQYWENLLKKKPNWIDYMGALLIAAGSTYATACLAYPTVKSISVPVSIHDILIVTPLSLALITLGIISIAHNTQRKLIIPIIITLLEAYTSLGLLCTSIGARAHFRIKKMGIILAILTVSFTILQIWAEMHAARLQSEDTLRRLLIGYIDRHNVTISSRASALDLRDSIAGNLSKITHPQQSALSASVAMLNRIYMLDQPSAPLTREKFRKNLEYESKSHLSREEIDRAIKEFSYAANERHNLDILIYLTLAASIEHALSIDGQEQSHVELAMAIAQEALKKESQAESEAQEGQLPALYSYRNAYGVAIENFALSNDNRNLEDSASLLENAYDSFVTSAKGPLFCRQRSTNNVIDLEMKAFLLDAEIRDKIIHNNSPLGKEIKTALTNPDTWRKDKLQKLEDLENYLSLPEISLTKLQVISVFAAERYKRDGPAFCTSEEFINAYQSGESALRKSLLLGFSDCNFFRDADASHIPIFKICPPPPNQQSLCSTLRTFIRRDVFAACTLCSAD